MRILVAHNKEHIDIALAAAKAANTSVTFQSPEHGLQAHGLGVLTALFKDTDWILYCGDETALAVEAMRVGVKKLRVNKSNAAYAKLTDIARQIDVLLITEAYEALDMGKSFSPAQDCAVYLRNAA